MQDTSVAIPTTSPQNTAFQISSHQVAKRARIVFAAALGFYLYALFLCSLLIGAGWLAIAAANWVTGGQGGIIVCAVLPVTAFCVGSALLILWSLIPRPRRFVVPGPRLHLHAAPGLHEAVADIARRTNQPMPAEVYVNLQVNAAVTERGGILGMNKRRVLFLGLPIFPLLTLPQFKSVLAHEFGHFYWGDTRLGPWVHRAHLAIRHTTDVLHEVRYTAWINLLLFGYAEWFLDIAQDLSRKQEFLADQLAARTTSTKAAIEALQLTRVGEDAFDAYWRGTIAPMLRFGVRLPLLEGFRRFLAVQTISSAVLRTADTRMQEDKTDELDSHPALPERVAALAHLPAEAHEPQATSEVPTIALLGDPTAFETALIGEILGKSVVSNLRFVTWEDALDNAYIPLWQDTARTYARGLEGVTPEALPDLVKNLSTFGMELLKKANQSGEIDSLSSRTGVAIGSALALALHAAGWQLQVSPGQPVRAQRGGQRIEPFEVMGRLVARKLAADEWRALCHDAGIAGTDLGKLPV